MFEPTKATEEVKVIYCDRCHLANPNWKERCIHCNAPLFVKGGELKAR